MGFVIAFCSSFCIVDGFGLVSSSARDLFEFKQRKVQIEVAGGG